MRTTLLASLSALALMTSPALAQKTTSSTSSQTGSTSSTAESGRSGAQDRGGAEMLGRKVNLADGSSVGTISDVLIEDGKASAAVVDLDQTPGQPVVVRVTQLSPSGNDYVVSLERAEVEGSTPYRGPGSGQRSLNQSMGRAGTGADASATSQSGAGNSAGRTGTAGNNVAGAHAGASASGGTGSTASGGAGSASSGAGSGVSGSSSDG